MKKQLLLTLTLLLLGVTSLFAQTPTKLSGDIIGTQWCVDYDNNNAQTQTINTAKNLFDGKLDNYFATYQRSGGWAGLDLGEKYVITQVAYCPRLQWPQRTTLGVFEGANTPDFIDAVPLCIIDKEPQENTLTQQAVTCTRGFRYVRYVGPSDVRCNIAELEFYGYKGEGSDERLTQLTNLPTITIHTKNAEDIIEKEKYIEGVVSIISEDGKEIFTADLEIRGRGNASWGFPKKPYRMKLKEKASLLGNPAKEKSWTLINNYGDKTLMRNLLAFDLSRRFDMDYTSVGRPVDVILNGEYKGCYQLCDHIQVAKGRVDIDKKTGTFLEIDAYASSEPEGEWFTTNQWGQIPVTIKHPEDDDLKQRYNDIKAHFEKMVASIHAANFTDPADGFRKYLDVESFLRHFLIGEISGNTDTYWSVYMYRKDGTDDTYYVGPVWDFDIAYENDNRTYPINENPNWIYCSKGSTASGMKELVNRLMIDPAFLKRLKSLYAEYRDNGKITTEELISVVDKYEKEMDQSQRLNFMRWPILNSKVHQNNEPQGSYDKEVEIIREYIKARIEWMDKKLSYVPASINEEKNSNLFVRTDKGNVHIQGISSSRSTIKVYNISGQEVYRTTTTSSAISIPLGRGSYIIQVEDNNRKVETIKCMVAQ